ncbi:hypothetical protein [Micromonospora sp. NPDC004551]|uniref:hypothetical protein n=1 Tax=Micromonospora sp. NPDC004551 TaxID=3154284 RepID=UPI0033AD8A02
MVEEGQLHRGHGTCLQLPLRVLHRRHLAAEGTTTRQLRPYTGSGDRTVARATRNSTTQTISLRNHVDVDVQIDTSEQPYNQANINCVVN